MIVRINYIQSILYTILIETLSNIIIIMYYIASGVLWTGLETVVPGAQEVVKYLRQKVFAQRCSVDNTIWLSDFQFEMVHQPIEDYDAMCF